MPLPDNLQVHLVNSVDEAVKFLEWVKQDHEVLAYDIETTGLDRREDGAAIRLAQLGSYDQGWAVPWQGWGGVFMEALSLWEGRLTGHNVLGFDNPWLEHFAGWKPPYERLDDTQIMAKVVDASQPDGLKVQGDRYVDKRISAFDKMLMAAFKQQGWTYATVPIEFEVYWQYGCIDTVGAAHLWKYHRADLHYPEAYSLEMNVRRVLTQMENKGIRLDVDYAREKYKQLVDYVNETKQWAIDNWGVNVFSSPDVIDLFQNRLGAEITRQTKTGAPSVDADMREIFEMDPNPEISKAATFITDLKQADKKATTYFKNFLNFEYDGVVHTHIKSMGARTGRMSSTDPGLLNIGKTDPMLRDAFLPHEGEVLLSCDYSQIELRLMCHFSGDQHLAETFHNADATGGDFFVEMGKAIYSDPTFHKKDPRRNLIKTFMYAFLYGAGIPKMALSAKVSEAEMREFVDQLDKTYPGISDFKQRIIQTGDQRERSEGRGYVITPFNRKLYCDRGQSKNLVNYILQGHAAEILKEAIIKLDAAGLTDYLLLPIHDEIIASVPPEDYEQIAKEIGDIMTVRGKYAVDLIAEPEGPFERWGDKVRAAA